jgi:hypothetical protein
VRDAPRDPPLSESCSREVDPSWSMTGVAPPQTKGHRLLGTAQLAWRQCWIGPSDFSRQSAQQAATTEEEGLDVQEDPM